MQINTHTDQQTCKFSPGQVVTTPGALEAMSRSGIHSLDLLKRHLAGDWGDVSKEDAQANQNALASGARLLSSYAIGNGARIWIITEAETDDQGREYTTFLLPEEY